MAKLEDLPIERLRDELGRATDAKSAKRLMIAIAYKKDVAVETLSQRYGIPQSTIYYWLDRFEERPLEDALEDEARPGRPPKLTDEQRETVESWLDSAPTTFGYEAETWDAATLREQIRDSFDVDYSVPHVRRTFLE